MGPGQVSARPKAGGARQPVARLQRPAPHRPRVLLITEGTYPYAIVDETIAETTSDLEAFRFAEATRRLREFTWGEFCDWYVEFVKTRLRDHDQASRPVAQRVVATVLDTLCRLVHPVMPFVTEQIWQSLGQLAPIRGIPGPRAAEPSVCIASWPLPLRWSDPEARATVAQWQEKIQALRNLKAERNIPKEAKIVPIIIAEGPVADRLRLGAAFLKSLTNAADVTIAATAVRQQNSATAVLADAEVILPLEGLIDKEVELARLRKTHADLERQIGPLKAKIANEGFVSRAPAEVVEGQRARLAELESQRAAVAVLIDKVGPR